MKVFVSYSSRDRSTVQALVGRLEAAGHQVWFDNALRGGDLWWSEILGKIRDCSVFVFAVSDDSLRSKPCRAELDYAQDLGLPIVPVQLAHVSNYRTDPIFTRQLIDVRPGSATGAALEGAIHQAAARPVNRPGSPPAPPPIPFEYLIRCGAAIRGSAQLSPPAQAAMTFELRTALEEEDDPAVGADIRDLLQGLRTRGDVTVPVARELDALLGVTDVAPAGAAAPPASRRGRVADVATTYSLLVFEFVLAALIALIVLNAGDRCSADGEACGAGAPWTGYGLNALLFVGALVWSLRRLSSRRLAYVVPLAGCLVHFVLLIVVSVVWAR